MVDKNQQVIDKTLEQEYKYGFTTDVDQTKFEPGLDEEVIAKLSKIKNEPEWLLEWRLKAFKNWKKMSEPTWAKVLTPLNLGKYFKGYKDVNEMDWYDQIIINEDLKISLLPAVHWSKRSLTDTNKTLWGNFLIEHKNKKILFACDTGYGKVYKELGEKYGPIDLTMINIGAYNFKPMFDKTIYHTTPEEALNVAQDLKSKKVLGMHWGTFVLSLEPIMEPPIRFKDSAEKYGFNKEDAIIFKIGEVSPLDKLL